MTAYEAVVYLRYTEKGAGIVKERMQPTAAAARRARERETRREAILQAAERLFAERGFETATMDAVAHAAAFTKRTVYQYFPGKEDMLFEIAARILLRTVPSLDGGAGTPTTGEDRLARFARGFYDAIRAHPAEAALMDTALTLRSAFRARKAPVDHPDPGFLHFESRLTELYVAFVGSVVLGKKDHSLRADLEPEGAAFALFFLLKSFLAFTAFGEVEVTASGGMSGDDLARYSLELVLAGMRPKKED